ncbi:MAG: thioredoxin-dependent thiol peroxidase [Hyphomicrobiales bacterium]
MAKRASAGKKKAAKKKVAKKKAGPKAAKSRPKPKAAKKKAAKRPAASKKKAAPAPKHPPAAVSRKGKGASRAQQGSIEFEEERAAGRAEPEPPPRRRSSKQGGPDWPGENLTVGMAAPEFSLPSTLGRRVTLSEFRGKRVILYFYPKDDTPGCTMEACAFRDNLPRIEAKDAIVLGISLDDELSHQRFAQKYNLSFPLLSDVDAAVSRQYGVYKEKSLYGRSFWGIERTTFVVDREGNVENVFRRVKVEGHADEVLATLAV